ncbi:intercellular adhesion molecule 5-like [Hyperolius riggenbachi]|uniref:intercellular adhesion molecule 5-like n=1 Tax=Hyperolius riggenbachi TaxID=752182 RepID=UPI0035A354D7
MERSVIWILASIAAFNALTVYSTLPVPVIKFQEKIYEDESTDIICTLPYNGTLNATLTVKGNGTVYPCKPSYNKENHTSVTCTVEVTTNMHEMEFTCEAEFKTQSAPQKMHLQTDPEITDCPDKLVWIEGLEYSFHCKAKGYPPPNVTCQKNNATTYKEGEKVTAKKSMAGEYRCTAMNFDIVSKEVMVSVEYKPKISSITVNPPLHDIRDHVNLTCEADGLPNPTYSWKTPSSDVQFSPNNQTITIQSLQQEHIGRYECTVQNPHGTDTLEQTLDLAVKPRITRFDVQPASPVLEDTNVTITCEASGFPLPVLKLDTPSPSVETSPNHSIVRIWKVKKIHVGEYRCQAQNKHGTDTQSQQLTLAVKPKINRIKVQPLAPVEDGSNVTLTCIADGVPTPTFSWSTPTANVQYNADKSSINIGRAEKEHDGEYQCKVQNEHGEDTMKQKLLVKASKGSRGQRDEPATFAILTMLLSTCLFYYFC